jgi:hypothetical protein
MADDLIPILTRFHREIVLPDIERVVGGLRDEMNARFAAQDAHFVAIYQRFDRLEAEYQSRVDGLQGQVRTPEERRGA